MIICMYYDKMKGIFDHRLDMCEQFIADLIINPIKCEHKHNVPMIYWGNSKTRKKEIAGNWGDRCAIVLDYDEKGGASIDEFISANYKFRYYLHTSHSHTPDAHCFRVIIPTNIVFNYNKYITDELVCLFGQKHDPSTFTNRGFYTPSTRGGEYRWHINQGELFDMENLLKIAEIAENNKNEEIRLENMARRNNSVSNTNNIDRYREVAYNNIYAKHNGCGKVENGHRYTDIINYTKELCNATTPNRDEFLFDRRIIEKTILAEHDDANVRNLVKSFINNRRI